MTTSSSLDTSQDPASGRLPIWLVVLILTLSTFWAYRTSFRGDFVLDDIPHIVENPSIRTVPSITELITGRNRPLVFWTLALNFRRGGVNPFGYHVFNLAVHLAAGLTLFGIVRRTLRLERTPDRLAGSADGLALAVAWLWLVHPLQTSAVTYVIQRCESMVVLCYLVCLYSVVRGSQSRVSWLWYLIAIAACVAGFGCKEVMVTAPLVILIYDRVFLSQSWGVLLRRRWWVYIALAVPAIATASRVFGAPLPSDQATAGFAMRGVSPWEYLCTQAGVLTHYLRLSLWPHPLCLDYQWPFADGWQEIVLPGVLIVGLLLASVVALWKSPRIGFLGIAFFCILAPTSSFVPVADAAFEHRMYLPLAAILMLLVLAVTEILNRFISDAARRHTIAVILLGFTAVWWSVWTADRNRDYSDGLRMWTSIVNVAPHNYRAHLNRGIELERRGQMEEAKFEFDRVLELNPTYDRGHMNIARWYAIQDQPAAAISHYNEAIRLRPNYPKAYSNLGNVYARQGDLSRAEMYYRKSLTINPRQAPTYLSLGLALWEQGRWSEAIAATREANRLMPDLISGRLRLAWMLATVPDESLRKGREAVQLVQPFVEYPAPTSYEAKDILAASHAADGDFTQAVQWAHKAIEAAKLAEAMDYAAKVESRLKSYEADQPYIDLKD